jgi:hypothetical protein
VLLAFLICKSSVVSAWTAAHGFRHGYDHGSHRPRRSGLTDTCLGAELTGFYRLHSFIVMASTNEYTRKILNSPAHAEPCLVASAKQVLCADNW